MRSLRARARVTGLLYFVFSLIAIVNQFLFPRFLVPGDPVATARHIQAAESTYRAGVLLGFATIVFFLFVVWSVYNLLRDVNRSAAMLMMMLVAVGVAVEVANLLTSLAPAILLGAGNSWPAFSEPQVATLAHASLRLHSAGGGVVTGFWGLWLFPFGYLVIRSGFFPRALGWLLMVAGAAYVATSALSVLNPGALRAASPYLMPLYFGEVPIILWMLVLGARAPEPAPRPA